MCALCVSPPCPENLTNCCIDFRFSWIHARISKKYENTGYSGKTQYAGRASNLSLLELQARRQELEKKKKDFLESREHLKSKSSNKKKHHNEFATPRIIAPGSSNTIESLTQGHNSRDTGLMTAPGMINLPAQGLRPDLDWNNLAHSNRQLVYRPGLLPLTSGLFPSSLGLASGNTGIRHNLPGSLQYRSLADTSALLGARNALAGFPASHPPVHEAPLSLQHLSFQHGNLLRTTAPSHLPVLNRATSEALRRNLETTALLDEYKRSLQQKQDQKRHSWIIERTGKKSGFVQ